MRKLRPLYLHIVPKPANGTPKPGIQRLILRSADSPAFFSGLHTHSNRSQGMGEESALNAKQLEFLAEEEQIVIIPNFKLPTLHFIRVCGASVVKGVRGSLMWYGVL